MTEKLEVDKLNSQQRIAVHLVLGSIVGYGRLFERAAREADEHVFAEKPDVEAFSENVQQIRKALNGLGNAANDMLSYFSPKDKQSCFVCGTPLVRAFGYICPKCACREVHATKMVESKLPTGAHARRLLGIMAKMIELLDKGEGFDGEWELMEKHLHNWLDGAQCENVEVKGADQ